MLRRAAPQKLQPAPSSGAATRHKAAVKGKEVKEAKEAEDPKAKAKRLVVLAFNEKKKNQKLQRSCFQS